MANINSGQLTDTILIEDNETVLLREDIIAPLGDPAVNIIGDDARLIVTPQGSIEANDDGNSAVVSSGSNAQVINRGAIAGDFNGISTTGDDFRLINSGTISSDSRAVDLTDGDGLVVQNSGEILGTDDQRNGTLYVDGTVDDLRVINTQSGVIDAGEGNLGDGISVQVGAGDDLSNEDINIINSGLIQGRGDGPEVFADGGRVTANGSSGVRFFNGVAESETTVTGSIVNRGTITSEVNVGFLGGVVVEDDVAFDGRIVNTSSGLISGPRNGLYIGNAEHDLNIINRGTIESGSRAVNLDGDNVLLSNTGSILGTGDQRNGTVYIDGTGDDIQISNGQAGTIDAGEGNLGDGIAVQVGAGEDLSNENINIVNRGLIQGRGDGPEVFADGSRVASNGSSGVRFFNGVGESETTLTGRIVNRGTITSEVNVGFLGGVVVEDGVAFDGRITNTRSGLISGPRNGLYIGNAEHDLDIINKGTIESGSRAVNLDGDNVSLINSGSILGTGNQRNGTVYIDGTGDDISINNTRNGVIDAGEGNSGSGVSVQVGAANGFSDGSDDIETSANIVNAGSIQGRGTENVPAGVRLFVGSGLEEATFTGNIENRRSGEISSETDAGLLIESGVIFNGQVTNAGSISGGNGFAIDADGALGSINVLNTGSLTGEVRLGSGEDSFVQNSSEDVVVTGGLGEDSITGGSGSDTVRFDDIDAPVTVTLDDSGNGTATREVGFAVNVVDVEVDSLNLDAIPDDTAFLTEALAGNLYFNIHSNDFNGGEIRGQLDTIVSDTLNGGVRTIVLSAALDAAQEPGDTSDSEATGVGVVTLVVAEDGEITYDVELETTGLATSDLLPVAGFSAIHLHNAPLGVNGPVILDIIQDAGGDIFGVAQSPGVDSGDGNVFSEIIETDTLAAIENVVGSNDNDVIIAGAGNNVLDGNGGNDELAGGAGADTLLGGAGDDLLRGGGGNDVTDGGLGIDTADFSDIGSGVTASLDGHEGGTAVYQGPNGQVVDQLISIENLNGSANNDVLTGNSLANVLSGNDGNDELIGGSGDDFLAGGRNNDILTGGFDSDTFQFGIDTGVDIVTDFSTVEDFLDVSAIFNDVSDILGVGGAATQVGTATLIDFGDDNAAVLLDVNVSDLSNDNFILG